MILLTLPSLLLSQIVIDKAGDGWDSKIDSALQLIKKTDISVEIKNMTFEDAKSIKGIKANIYFNLFIVYNKLLFYIVHKNNYILNSKEKLIFKN